jgi:hypothetical protein
MKCVSELPQKLEKIISNADESPFYCHVCVCAILINITYKTTPIVGTSIRMLYGIHTYTAWYGEDKNSCICHTQTESWSPNPVTILNYPSWVRTKINYHKPPSMNTENTQFQNMHR